MNEQPIVIWQIHDDKPGHRNQLRGLTSALADVVLVEHHAIRAPRRRSCLTALFARRFRPGNDLPAPDLILGAGHATHLAVLAAQRAFGGKTIVLMKPSLPTALFDLCIVPRHDGVPAAANVVTTRGVLNVIRPARSKDQDTGLLLIGGPSAAHGWSDEAILEQVTKIAGSDTATQWQLTTSRRTPSSLVPKLKRLGPSNVDIVPHEQTTSDWLPRQLTRASQVWVSEDSVSMVYEALTCGAAVGLLRVPSKKQGRVAAGVDVLVQENWVTQFTDWQPGTRLSSPPAQLDEARRCARLVCERLLSRPAVEQAG